MREIEESKVCCVNSRIVLMRAVVIAILAGAPALLLAQSAPGQADYIRQQQVVAHVDSGPVAAEVDPARFDPHAPQVVFTEIVGVQGAPWVRVHFGDVMLGGSKRDGTLSKVRITSLDDGAQQHLDATALRRWRNASAYFNGSHVLVELLAHPGTGANRLVIERITAGQQDDGGLPATICDGEDNRIQKHDPRVARSIREVSGEWLARCTMWLFNDHPQCLLTAGHCVVGSLIMVEFNIPDSLSDGTPQFSDPEDQYPVDWNAIQSEADGIGFDWGVVGVFANTETGLTPLEAQGETFYLADSAPPPAGQELRLRGCGRTDITELPNEWNRTVKLSEGPYTAQPNPNAIRHRADTTSGDSGSAIKDLTSGLIIGIHTHGGCAGPSQGNHGTVIHQADLQNALANPQGTCVPAPGIGYQPTSIAVESGLGESPPEQTLEIWNDGDGQLIYSISTNEDWLDVSPSAGTSAGEINDHTVSFATADLETGDYQATITITADDAFDSPQTIPVSLTIEGISGDLTGDGTVGVPDLLILINSWGDCADCDDCPADLTGDCTVGVPDLLILIGNWG